jgi:hypothetical protein
MQKQGRAEKEGFYIVLSSRSILSEYCTVR